MTHILVSGASGIVGYGILRSLREGSKDALLIGTTIYDDSVAPAFCDQVEIAPRTDDPTYLSWLLNTIKENNVDLIVPGIEVDLYTWCEHRDAIENLGCKIVLNRSEFVVACQDKWSFYQALRKAQMPYTIPSSLSDNFEKLQAEFGLPFLLKPRHGFGGKGIVVVDSKETFCRSRKAFGETLFAQPIIGTESEEYTIGVFGDGEGACSAQICMQRTLSLAGFTETASIRELACITQAIGDLCTLFRPIGPTNLQFRIDDEGAVKLLEINPRISSSTSIRTRFGYNECQMAVDYYLHDIIPTQPTIRSGRAVRYMEDMVFYDDRNNF